MRQEKYSEFYFKKEMKKLLRETLKHKKIRKNEKNEKNVPNLNHYFF